MSDVKHGRFEIDLDEIERQLRRSVEAGPPAKNDPLAELARIVGQDDPFRSMFAGASGQAAGAASIGPAVRASEEQASRGGTDARVAELDGYRREQDAVLHDQDDGKGAFDPVANAYGSLENALDEADFRPLAPRRSRRRLLGVGALVVVAVVGTAGTLVWRNGGKFPLASGTPPTIRADNAPLKVAPENPGGMEIPNQNKQIYERGQAESQTRVVDQREQPIDVREAARALPPVPATNPVPADPPRSGVDAPAPDVGRPTRSSAVANALGEPRRVRTVSVRPDGTLFDAPPSASPAAVAPSIVPSAASLPPPVQVATIPITLGTPTTTATASPSGANEAGALPESISGATPAGRGVSVLPPQRPRPDGRAAVPSAPSPVASAPVAPRVANAAPAPEAAAGGAARAFTVQLGIRTSEEEARTASTELAGRYASDLGGRTPTVARADVNGRTVYRMRVGPLGREDANALCTRLKNAGGQCFVAQN